MPKKNKRAKPLPLALTISRVISRLFDPTIEMPLILVTVVSMVYLNGYRWRYMLLLFVLDAVLPGLVFAYLLLKHKSHDWDMRIRQERLPLFAAVVVFHGIGVITGFLINRHPLAEILLALWFLTVFYSLVTVFWKVSIHMGVNATLAWLAWWVSDGSLWWVWLIPLAVGWARIYDKHHTLPQVLLGGLVPPLFLYWAFSLFGI